MSERTKVPVHYRPAFASSAARRIDKASVAGTMRATTRPLHYPRMPTYRVAILLALLPLLSYCAKSTEDVAAFQERRTKCDHFRGEDPYNKDRAQFIAEQLKKYCAGTDAELAQLKKKYAGDHAVMNRLNTYEERIE